MMVMAEDILPVVEVTSSTFRLVPDSSRHLFLDDRSLPRSRSLQNSLDINLFYIPGSVRRIVTCIWT